MNYTNQDFNNIIILSYLMTKTILIAEDDIELLNVYAEILQINKYDVQTAKNGEEAISKYIQKHSDLVILDLDIPKFDGYETFSQIIKINKNAKVIIITGYTEFESKNNTMLEQGVLSIISKPIGVDMLLDTIEKYTKLKKTEKQKSIFNSDLERSIR